MELPYELHNVICPACKANLPAMMICRGFSFPVCDLPVAERVEVFLCPECSADFFESDDPKDRTAIAKTMFTNTSNQPYLAWSVTTQLVIAEHHGDVLAAIVEGRKMSDEEYARLLSDERSTTDVKAQS